MLKMLFGTMLMIGQLSGPGGGLPQILTPNFKFAAPVAAGKKAELTVAFSLLKGYAINRTPEVTLKLTPVEGLKLDKMEFKSSPIDPKSKDEYYVDLPILKVPLTAAKAGRYEIPAKLVYFFCSKADGFCSRQVVDVKVPVSVQ